LIEQWNEFTADREAEICELLKAGEITPKAAEAIRRWHLPPERPLLPPPSEPEVAIISDDTDAPQPPAAPPARQTPPLYSATPERETTTPRPAMPPAGDDLPPWCPAPAPVDAVTILFTEPFRNFWIGGRGVVSADENGEIVASNASIAENLLRAGCRASRDGRDETWGRGRARSR
jgi:hypothetical protein